MARKVRIASSNRDSVDRGCELDESIKTQTLELDTIKADLRREGGLSLAIGVSEVELEGRRGVASIVYPRPSYKLDETRIEELRTLLGPRFSEFVTTRTVYSPADDFEEMFDRLDPALRKPASNIIIVKPSTPRVSFGRVVRT